VGAALAMAVVLLGSSDAAAFSWFIGAGVTFVVDGRGNLDVVASPRFRRTADAESVATRCQSPAGVCTQP
jgi:hypothetical protein